MAYILLIVEDNKIADLIADFLIFNDFYVEKVIDGIKGRKIAVQKNPDLILMDMFLTKGNDGLTLSSKLKKDIKTAKIPIILFTALDLKNQIRKCDAGFDEYITKPFSLEELYVRIKILLRRTNSANFKNGILNFGPLKLLPRTIMAKWFKSHVELKPVEFEFLYCLLQRHDRPVQIELIRKQVWGKVFENDINSIRGHVRNLREKLEPDPKKPIYIKTIYGEGYSLNLSP